MHTACSLWTILIAGGLLLGGCATHSAPATQPAAAAPAKKEQKSVDARNETLNVEVEHEEADISHCARGFFRPDPSPRPSDHLLDSIRSILPQEPIPTLITVLDKVPYEGSFPGGQGNFARWDQGVRDLVERNRGKAVQYEIVGEPDNKERFKGHKQDFFELYYHTYAVIRSVDPNAFIVGPSTSRHDGGWIADFLKIAKEYQVQPNAVTWYEPSPRTDISGHVGGTGENFWQDGSPQDTVRVGENNALARSNSPANVIFFAADTERAHKDNAFRRLHIRFAYKLSHLVSGDGKPRSNFFAYRAYAQLTGKWVKVNGSSTVDGIATWSKDRRSGTILLGRERGRQGEIKPETPPLGDVFLEIKQLKFPRVHIVARRLTNSRDNSSEGPAEVFTADYVVQGEQVRIGLPQFEDGCVYLLEISEYRSQH